MSLPYIADRAHVCNPSTLVAELKGMPTGGKRPAAEAPLSATKNMINILVVVINNVQFS